MNAKSATIEIKGDPDTIMEGWEFLNTKLHVLNCGCHPWHPDIYSSSDSNCLHALYCQVKDSHEEVIKAHPHGIWEDSRCVEQRNSLGVKEIRNV